MAGLMGLNWGQQKELLKLRARLSFRQFMGEKARLLTAIATIAVLVPVSFGVAAATGAGYLLLPNYWPAQLLGFVLLLSWFIWSVAPVFSFNVNEGLDPTRLLSYPIARRDYLAHMLLGTLLDYPTYFIVPFFIAIIVGFGLGWGLPVVLVALILSYLLMVLTSQTIINTLGGVLQSRRFRDISMVVGAFIGMSCWLISQSMQGVIENFFDLNAEEVGLFFQTWQPLDAMKWLPPGAAAKAIEQASIQAWGGSLLWLGYTLLWAGLLGWVWWRVTLRIVTGEGFVIGGSPAKAKESEGKTAAQTDAPGRFAWSWIPTDIRAIILKEIKLKWRTPQSRIGLIYMYLMPLASVVFLLIYATSDSDEPFSLGIEFIAGGIALYTIFIFWVNGQNMLGWETSGLPTLLLTPIPRQRIFLGKGLAQFVMNGPPLLLLAVLAMIVQPGLVPLALLPTTAALGLACLSVVSLFSVIFPYPVKVESQAGQNPFSGGGGCLTGLANGTLMPTIIGLVCLPIGAPLALALWQGWGWLALLGGFLGLAYSGVLFWFVTRWAAQIMVRREPEILIASRSKDSVNK